MRAHDADAVTHLFTNLRALSLKTPGRGGAAVRKPEPAGGEDWAEF